MCYYVIAAWIALFSADTTLKDATYTIHTNKEYSYSSEVIYKKAPMYFTKDLNTK